MEMEPSQQLLRAMDVDLGAGLGDDLGGFEGFDDLFANHNTSDFFKFCPLDEAQPDALGVTAPPSPGSSGVSASPLGQGEHDFAKDDWSRGQQQTPTWETALTPVLAPRMHVRGKPRARKRHDEDEALEAEEATHPVPKVGAGRKPLSFYFVFFFNLFTLYSLISPLSCVRDWRAPRCTDSHSSTCIFALISAMICFLFFSGASAK